MGGVVAEVASENIVPLVGDVVGRVKMVIGIKSSPATLDTLVKSTTNDGPSLSY